MLRVSSEAEDGSMDIDLGALVGNRVEGSGIAGAKELIEFAEAALGDDAISIRQARERVSESLGEAAMIDAAGIIANFQRMVRIADGTGIPLDPPMAAMTSDIRSQLGINQYGSAGNTPTPGLVSRVLARVARPLLPLLSKPKKNAKG